MKNQQPPTRKEIQDQAGVLLTALKRNQKSIKDKTTARLISGLKQLSHSRGSEIEHPIKRIGELGFLGLLDNLDLNIKSKETIKNGTLWIDKVKVQRVQSKYRFNLYHLVIPKQGE